MSKNLNGVYAVVITPFHEDGTFNIEASKNHLDNLIEKGIRNVCILGATGEYQSVTNEEHKSYVSQIIPYITDRVTVAVGVSRERPEEVVELMNHAEKEGADAAMVLPPFYCHPNQVEILAFYRYISEHSTLPIMVYNNPGSAGVDIAPETLREIFKLPTAKLIKESTGEIQRLTDALYHLPSDITVLCGCDNMALPSFLMGSTGWISMAANFAPQDCCALLEAAQAKDMAKAHEIYKRLVPALNILESTEKPGATIKYILTKYRGTEGGHMRRPRIDLTQEEKEAIDNAMDYSTIC